jgi:hypothetical protein
MGAELKAQRLVLGRASQRVDLTLEKFQYLFAAKWRPLAIHSQESSLINIHIALNRTIDDELSVDFNHGREIAPIVVAVPQETLFRQNPHGVFADPATSAYPTARAKTGGLLYGG